jgi:hypothetical protein
MRVLEPLKPQFDILPHKVCRDHQPSGRVTKVGMIRYSTQTGAVGTLLRRILIARVPVFIGRLFNSYRPEKHYMRGPGPKTLGMIGRRFRAETRSVTKEPLPETWLGLIHSLDEQERMQRRADPSSTPSQG